MNKSAVVGVKDGDTRLFVTKRDVIEAWIVLENLAVSLDRIGSAFARGTDAPDSVARAALEEALIGYFAGGIARSISEARMHLGRYLSDEEAESLSDQIKYWEYESQKK